MTDALMSASWRLGAVGAGDRGRRKITGDWEVRGVSSECACELCCGNLVTMCTQ
ncbi:hypothetical protein E2C01_090544 [Portunus trituberculatus]|uniref:Uncharacterized protein n=1 Tax=Portunus trituberculatus TaxID=210409 RepID=A0A5B7JQE2_PORTR|nr:hypothetical protein [Portunus trituberculatus]